MNLNEASRQWAERPPDERFESLEAMRDAAALRRSRCAEAIVPSSSLTFVETQPNGLALVGPTGRPALMTNWSFTQACKRLRAPADYLSTLPPSLAATNLNVGAVRQGNDNVNLLMDVGNGAPMTVRSIMSDSYDRAWDDRLVDALIELRDAAGWQVPPARPATAGQPGTRLATEADVLAGDAWGLSVKVGDEIAPAGLYAGDRDSFVFMVNQRAQIADGTDGGMFRGFFMEHSEVGRRAFNLTTFLYRHVCGNHIVWDAAGVRKVHVIHVGSGVEGKAIREARLALEAYAGASATDDQLRVRAAQNLVIGPKKEDVVDALFARKLDLSRAVLGSAYDVAAATEKDPTTAWGMAQGVTRLSQQQRNADRRTEMDRAAGRILRMAF